MRKVFTLLLLVILAVGAWYFVQSVRGTQSWGVGTGKIGQRSGVRSHSSKSTPSQSHTLAQIVAQPQKFVGKTVVVSGRVQGAAKYASNRNIYRLTDGKSTLLVVDDKPSPKDLWPRQARGVVKVLQNPLGKDYAYVVSVKGDPKLELQWQDVKRFFGEKFEVLKKDLGEAVR